MSVVSLSSPFPYVDLAPERILTETVGLRPFRAAGPRLEIESLGAKKLVHHYGHGGSGWSLSWGSAQAAAELVKTLEVSSVAVIGCGAIGLTTARVLQQRGYRVTIYARDTPPGVTSSKAAGNWSPASRVCSPDRVTPQFGAWWERAAVFSFQQYRTLAAGVSAVHEVDNFRFGGPWELYPLERQLPLIATFEEAQPFPADRHPFDEDVLHSKTFVFDIPAHFQKLLSDFRAAGGVVQPREFHSPAELTQLPEPCLVNCTGLGAKALFGDKTLQPIAGQLAKYPAHPTAYFKIDTPEGALVSRPDGIFVGGSADYDRWDTDPRPGVTQRTLNALLPLMAKLKQGR
ncbi:Glycine/D-amino acid oxidase [Catalinimonas alkaloidigena]|uniref:D-amino-acid oxidase n=1 Tax=Catalinimonas alkaloidigena TaxID=1075417 RepID=A0A1G9R2H5_9BACT|nr:FAD-dependent oxidoreductase [Catalinimonas alkaloidigena]SDM17449.1 Glycine/D-amino acid oxidase [Catalinimonas alkaloidigena]